MPETHSEWGRTAPLQWMDDRSSHCTGLEGDGSRCLHTGGTSGGQIAAPLSPDTPCRRGADSTGGGGLLTLECTAHRGGRGQSECSPLPPCQTGCSPLEQTGQVDHHQLPLYLCTASSHGEWVVSLGGLVHLVTQSCTADVCGVQSLLCGVLCRMEWMHNFGRTDREQIRSRINNNDCRTFRPRRPLSTAYRTQFRTQFCTQLTKAFVAETSCNHCY